MQNTKWKEWLIIISTILWCVITVLGWKNENYVICLVLSVIMMGAYLMLGAAKNNMLSKKMFIYPILIWAVVWIASFVLAAYYGDLYAGVTPPLILGLHPSLACTMIGFWMGGLLTILLGWRINKDEWLSADDWERFVNRIKELDSQEKEGGAVK